MERSYYSDRPDPTYGFQHDDRIIDNKINYLYFFQKCGYYYNRFATKHQNVGKILQSRVFYDKFIISGASSHTKSALNVFMSYIHNHPEKEFTLCDWYVIAYDYPGYDNASYFPNGYNVNKCGRAYMDILESMFCASDNVSNSLLYYGQMINVANVTDDYIIFDYHTDNWWIGIANYFAFPLQTYYYYDPFASYRPSITFDHSPDKYNNLDYNIKWYYTSKEIYNNYYGAGEERS